MFCRYESWFVPKLFFVPSPPPSRPTRTPTASLVPPTTVTNRFRAADLEPVRQRTGLPLPLVPDEPWIFEAVAPTPSMHWRGPRTRPPSGASKVPPKRMILPGLPTPGLTVVGLTPKEPVNALVSVPLVDAFTADAR